MLVTSYNGFNCLNMFSYCTALFSASIVSSSVCYVTFLFLQVCPIVFYCFIVYYVTVAYYFFKVSIISLSVCYVTALFSASIAPSSVCYATILFLQGFIVPFVTSLLCSRRQLSFRPFLRCLVFSLSYYLPGLCYRAYS